MAVFDRGKGKHFWLEFLLSVGSRNRESTVFGSWNNGEI